MYMFGICKVYASRGDKFRGVKGLTCGTNQGNRATVADMQHKTFLIRGFTAHNLRTWSVKDPDTWLPVFGDGINMAQQTL